MQDKTEQQTKTKATFDASNVQVTRKQKDIYQRVKEVLRK